MSIAKKPSRLHDVDLAGLIGLAVLGLVAWWLVIAPWQRTWSSYQELATRRATTEAGLQQDVIEFERFQLGVVRLEETIARHAEEVPQATSISRVLREMTDIAQAARLELMSVAPQPARWDGDYVINDIRVAGRGRSHDFIRFLDEFARENPYQSLEYCSITRPANHAEPTCELSWLVRLYLLPAGAESRVGGQR